MTATSDITLATTLAMDQQKQETTFEDKKKKKQPTADQNDSMIEAKAKNTCTIGVPSVDGYNVLSSCDMNSPGKQKNSTKQSKKKKRKKKKKRPKIDKKGFMTEFETKLSTALKAKTKNMPAYSQKWLVQPKPIRKKYRTKKTKILPTATEAKLKTIVEEWFILPKRRKRQSKKSMKRKKRMRQDTLSFDQQCYLKCVGQEYLLKAIGSKGYGKKALIQIECDIEPTLVFKWTHYSGQQMNAHKNGKKQTAVRRKARNVRRHAKAHFQKTLADKKRMPLVNPEYDQEYLF